MSRGGGVNNKQLKRSNKERGGIIEKCDWTETKRRESLAESTEFS